MNLVISDSRPDADEMNELRMLSIAQLCELSGLGETTVRKAIREGQLETAKVFNRRLITFRSAKKLLFPR